MILFLLIPGFYASVEQADQPALRGRPTLVGGSPRKRGVVTSASPEAVAKGVTEGMNMAEALERCPEAAIRPTRLRRYREIAAAVRSACWAHTDRVEPAGLEGVYLEIPEGVDPVGLAAELCLRVRAEHGLAAVAGIGPTRFVASAAARHCGEGGIRCVGPGEVVGFLGDLPLTEIWGLGPASAARLAARGLRRIRDVQDRSPEELEDIIGRFGTTFHRLAMGQDDDRIRARPRPKSISQEETLPEPTGDLSTLRDLIAELAGRIATSLEREARGARTVTVGVEFVDAQQVTRGQTEPGQVATRAEIVEVAMTLMGRLRSEGRRVRRLRLQVSNLAPRERRGPPRQLSLF